VVQQGTVLGKVHDAVQQKLMKIIMQINDDDGDIRYGAYGHFLEPFEMPTYSDVTLIT